MGMLCASSILNKVNNRSDGRFSDVALVVCPNVTIRQRLAELNPENGEASIYRSRDLVPSHLMPLLTQGKILVTNWHVFEPQSMQSGGVGGKVMKAGVPVRVRETIHLASKTTTARNKRYLSLKDYEKQVAAGMLTVVEEKPDKDGSLKQVTVESVRYVESDTALLNRVLGREIGGKQNILVLTYPLGVRQSPHQFSIQAARVLVVDVFDDAQLFQTGREKAVGQVAIPCSFMVFSFSIVG
jgi:type III restriction enzyme